jgi:hypothetical protein
MPKIQDADHQLVEFLRLTYGRDINALSEDEVIDLIIRFAIWPVTDSYINAPWVARFAVRRQRHRTDERAPGEKRDLWGMPDEMGFFADDNSLLKSAYKNLDITGLQNPYKTAKLSTGLVCCHIWSGTTSDPLLFSFLPNLVWLPKSLARFTDVYKERDIHRVHYVMQELSYRRYRELEANVGNDDCRRAWSKLVRPLIELADDIHFTEMKSEPSLSSRVRTRHLRLSTVLEAAISEVPEGHRRFSKRYHLGVGGYIDKTIPPLNELVSKDHLLDLKRIISSTTPL